MQNFVVPLITTNTFHNTSLKQETLFIQVSEHSEDHLQQQQQIGKYIQTLNFSFTV